MSSSKENLKERYAQMSDGQLLKIAHYEVADLTPTALEVLHEEIDRRELTKGIEKGISAQLNGVSEKELTEFENLIKFSPCPECGKNEVSLMGETVTEIVSVIFFTNRKENFIIACPDCLKKSSKSTFWRTIFLGWWAIPVGLVRTGQVVIRQFQSKEKLKELSRKGIRDFAKANSGFLKANEDKPEAILDLLKKNNTM